MNYEQKILVGVAKADLIITYLVNIVCIAIPIFFMVGLIVSYYFKEYKKHNRK